LKALIEVLGWPAANLVGAKAEISAWLIAQHSDYDISFQKYCLKLLKLQPRDAVVKWQIAFLTDRILINEREFQKYGTQFYITRSGVQRSRRIRNLKGLDRRRKYWGLEPFYEYKAKMRQRLLMGRSKKN
jgi:hypothetical protein